jgi:hypothetical protein
MRWMRNRVLRRKLIFVSALFVALLTVWAMVRMAAADELYDVAIVGGRVMDPESGLDAVRSVGVLDGKISAISETPLKGKTTIQANGLVVAPGFIDLHEHGQEPRNYEFQAHDGVTTSLELELGTNDVAAWYAARQGKSLINFGVSVGHIPVRMKVMHDPGTFVPTGDAAHRAATAEELAQIRDGMQEGFRQGALAEGVGVNYTAAATHSEIVEMFRIAANYGASVHVHLRYSGMKEPTTGLAALEEVVAAAAETGAALHVVHITSMGLKYTPELIAMVEGARRHGLDVTTECYPYTAGSTELQSAVFDPGWQESMGITYKDLQWTETGERLTAETFEKYRKQGGVVVIHSIPEEAARTAVANPTWTTRLRLGGALGDVRRERFHFLMDQAVGREDHMVSRVIRSPGKIGDLAAGLGDDDHSCRHVPGMQSEFPEAVKAPAGYRAQIEGRGPRAADAVRTQRELAVIMNVGVRRSFAHREASAEQALGELGHARNVNGLLAQISSRAPRRGKAFPRPWIQHHAGDRLAILDQPDGHRKHRKPVRKIGSAVERVNVPNVSRRRRRPSPALLRHDGVLRKMIAQPGDDRRFGALVRFGDDIHFALVGNFLGVIETRHHDVAGFARGFHRDFQKLRRSGFRDAHRDAPGVRYPLRARTM